MRIRQVLMLGLIVTASVCSADVIEFSSGKTREGKIVRENADEVVLQDPYTGEISFKKSGIKEIRRTGVAAVSVSANQVIQQATALKDAGKLDQALTVLLDAAKSDPKAVPALQQTFQPICYSLLERAQQKRTSDPESSYADFHALSAVLGHPAAASLAGDASLQQKLLLAVHTGTAESAYSRAAQISAKDKTSSEVLRLLQEAVENDPKNDTFRFWLAETAKADGENRLAFENYDALAKQTAQPDVRARALDAANRLRQYAVAPASTTPTPKPVVARPTPTPAPQQATATAPALLTPSDGAWWQLQFKRMKNGQWIALMNDITTQLKSSSDLITLLGVALVVILALWVIPYYLLRWISRKGDIVAGQYLRFAKYFGILTYFPYLFTKLLNRARVKNRCPFCNKGIDNIDSYADMNFYICPHCRENITPVYDTGAYIEHLIQQLDADAKRTKGSSSETVSERDAMQKLVRAIITMVVRRRASDLHADPETEGTKIRARIDGVMYDMLTVPRSLAAAFVSAIKIMANLDITERRVPQDGKASLWIDKNDIDLRLNTSPASMGEKVSVRILSQSAVQIEPSKLGLEGNNLDKYERSIHRPHGLIIVTGPTGSGKSTTLYVALNEVNTGDKNIITIEDPIEYHLKGLTQMQVNAAQNFTFETGLRSILRQDPDIIMVGEIRDRETAEIAIEAAMTGHLVFTTLHTIDAPTAFSRLTDLGVEQRRVSSAVICVISQRLLRTVCPDCKKPYKPKKQDLELLGIDQTAKDFTFVHGSGCDNCMNTGYFGRMAIFEFLTPDERMKEVIDANATAAVIRELARKTGYKSLREEGILKVMQGLTTVEEVIRVTT